MARLDVHERRDGGPGWFLNVQADLLSGLHTRLIVPLLPEDMAPPLFKRLNPEFEISGQRVMMATQLATAVHVRDLGDRVARLDDAHETVTGAIDMLLAGV